MTTLTKADRITQADALKAFSQLITIDGTPFYQLHLQMFASKLQYVQNQFNNQRQLVIQRFWWKQNDVVIRF